MDLYQEPNRPTEVYGGKLSKLGEQPFTNPIAKPKPLDPAQSWHYFHPGRVDRILAPESFRKRIKEIDARFDVAWHPINQRWVVWAHLPNEVKHPKMGGWKLIFVVKDPYTDEFVPLDERVLAVAWDRCGRKHGSGRAYWDRIESEYWRDKESSAKVHKQYVMDQAGDQWDHHRIQVSMHGKSSGSKFSKHHSGG